MKRGIKPRKNKDRLKDKQFMKRPHWLTAYNLRRLREERGLSMVEVAELYGCEEVSYIGQLENGFSGLGIRTRTRMTEILRCNESDFYLDPREPSEAGREVEAPTPSDDRELAALFIDRIEKLLAIMKTDRRRSLITVLDGIIAAYGRPLIGRKKEVHRIVQEVGRTVWEKR
jgi:transcriptional regulator with XRE-family HTH domain